jgi:outer membrane receptor for ferrienterochelin and colicin
MVTNMLIAANDNEIVQELFDMSLDELMNVKVQTGTLTGIENLKSPVSVTVITSEEIKLTPARNIYDLIEVYVPGAIWMNHHDSPHLGIRGIITDRNYKILLLLNGRVMNMKARNGATAELENWDMGDIHQIEIVRGPGSVTYGPGAVEAVINITTKSYQQSKTFSAAASAFLPYRNYGLSMDGHFDLGEEVKVYSYGSITSTQGQENTEGYYFGNTYSFGATNAEQFKNYLWNNYYRDYNDNPQIKLYLESDFLTEFKFWARYTSLGNSTNGIYPQISPMVGWDSVGYPIAGTPFNLKQSRNEHLTFTLSNNHQFDTKHSLSTQISWDTENNIRRQEYLQQPIKKDAPPDYIIKQLMDVNSLRNKYNYFAESELNIRSILNNEYSSTLTLAFGLEFSYNKWGAPWFEDETNFRMGDNGNIISGKNSQAYGYQSFFGTDTNSIYAVGSGWSTNTISAFTEINWDIYANTTLLLSARVDKDSYSKTLFSPRIVLIYDLDKKNILKLIAQRSLRMNTAEELFIQHQNNQISDPENLDNIEFIYTGILSERFLLKSSLFYSNLDVISWYDLNRTTLPTGNLKMFGFEIEAKYNNQFLDIGINHSFAKQLKWSLRDSLQQNGISFSDYSYGLSGSKLHGLGNDVNNWSNNSTKLFINIKLFNGDLIAHIDARVFWGFQGAKDGIKMIDNAISGNKDSTIFISIVNIINSNNIYSADFRINASMTYTINKNLLITAFAQNLFTKNNYRYTYEAGNKRQEYILRTSVVNEPFTFGMRLSYSY